MKKALSLMTAAALVLSLAACGSTASSAASSEAASSETASSDAASSEAASSEAASETETAELSTVEPGKLIMSTNAAFPPYEMTTDSGEFEGIDIETAQAIADKLGLELQIDDMDFDAALLAVQQGKSDMVMAGVTVTDERYLIRVLARKRMNIVSCFFFLITLLLFLSFCNIFFGE